MRQRSEPAPSGWCSAPEGARPKCEDCKSERCQHDCPTHAQQKEV